MKNKLLLSAYMLFFFAFLSCEEEGEKAVIKSNVTPNSIENLSSASFTLLYDESVDDFEPFHVGMELDYGFPASISSTVEIAKAGENFANAAELATTSLNSVTLTVGEMNEALLGLGLLPEEAADVQLRVRSTVNSNIATVFSSPLNLTITPYATTFPPIYIIGDAQGWIFPMRWNAKYWAWNL